MSDETRDSQPASIRDPLPDDADDEDGRIGEHEDVEPDDLGADTTDEDESDADAFDDTFYDDDDDLESDDDDVHESRRERRRRRRRERRRPEDAPDAEPDPERGGFWGRNVGRRLEGLMPEAVKRAVAGSVGSMFLSEDGLRQTLTEMKLPKEIAAFIMAQSNEVKRDFMRIVAREIREFLEHTDFYDEMARILTTLSFEIRTEIRLIPNDQQFVKPNVRNRVKVKRTTASGEEMTIGEMVDEPDEEKPSWTDRIMRRRRKESRDEDGEAEGEGRSGDGEEAAEHSRESDDRD